MTKEQAAKDYANRPYSNSVYSWDYNAFLAGANWQEKQEEERIKSLEEKLSIAVEVLDRVAKGTHEEHPTCSKCSDGSFGPPRTDGWEGWAREIDMHHKKICEEALTKIRGE